MSAESIRPCGKDDLSAMVAVINSAATAYAGVIPTDRYRQPYMPLEELRDEIAAGVRFWGLFADDGALAGVMGIQDVDDVTLIRHAYVCPVLQRGGVGGRLLGHLLALAEQAPLRPLLVGTWAAAWWAVAFYERHGFALVTAEGEGPLAPPLLEDPLAAGRDVRGAQVPRRHLSRLFTRYALKGIL